MNNLRSRFKDNFDDLKELPDYERAEVIVEEMFKGIKDKEGAPYIEHLRFVSDAQPTENGKIVGLLHDLIEDTDTSVLELQQVGFSDRILYSLLLLSKIKGTPYPEYIDKIILSNDEVAIRVKEADMRNNMDPERLANLSPGDRQHFIEKYTEPYQRILRKIEELENDRYQTDKRR